MMGRSRRRGVRTQSYKCGWEGFTTYVGPDEYDKKKDVVSEVIPQQTNMLGMNRDTWQCLNVDTILEMVVNFTHKIVSNSNYTYFDYVEILYNKSTNIQRTLSAKGVVFT